MWSPTHIQVTIQSAKGLLVKGKNGTNNCFVTIGLGKEKYQTSVKEKAQPNVSWNEECELKIPDKGNSAELVLTCLHRNNIGIDEFLGQVTLPLHDMDIYDRPRSKWFKLESKPGKEKKNKERGELEVRVSFIVKSGSLTDLSKKEKHKSSIGQLASSVGGSLLSIGTIEKRKGIKKFAKSLSSKIPLHGKKKNKDGDDVSSFSGSFNSIGTPNSSNGINRRYGQRAGDADPGVISEDEDEFVFDNLSHKSSASSLNMRSGTNNQFQLSTPNFAPRNPSPLIANGKSVGKQFETIYTEDTVAVSNEDQIEKEHSTQTLPPPTKPPRTPQMGAELKNSKSEAAHSDPKVDDWATKLYGKHLDISGTDSLKRHSWELNPVPLPISDEMENHKDKTEHKNVISESDSSSSMSEEDDPVPPPAKPNQSSTTSFVSASKSMPQFNLLSPDEDSKKDNFDQLNATFAKFEQRNSAKIFDVDVESRDKKWQSQSLVDAEKQAVKPPQARPRVREPKVEEQVKLADENSTSVFLKEQEDEDEARKRRAEEDARLEEELRLNEQRLRDEEQAFQEELRQREEAQKRRDVKRREEDERILSFGRQRSVPTEERDGTSPVPHYASTTPEQSPKQRIGDNREKRFGKFKYFNKKDKNEGGESSSPSPKSNERIIIGHEKTTSHAERRSEMTVALAKKYEGKSREELMLIANGMENEALIQRQRVKELEDYLDNLLLRVMETHPKLLQNPYSRTTSAKSG